MSTAGKVLTVVVILALVGWIFLFAQIAQLNANWGQKIDQLTEQVETLKTDVAETQGTLDTRLAEITFSQDQRDRAMTVLKSRLSHVEKLQALNQEALVREGLQIELLKTGNTQAEKALADRVKEKQQTNDSIAQTRAEVGVLEQQVGHQMDQLKSLREQFLTTHAENEKMLDQLRRGGNQSTGSEGGTSRNAVRVRPASRIGR